MVVCRWVSLLLAAVLLAIAPAASASVMVEVTVDEMAREADLVARGKVVRTESRRSVDGMRIFTEVTLQVDERWKGASGSTVRFRVPGGTHDGIAQIVQGAPRFTEGEEVIVFLHRLPQPKGLRDRPMPMQVVAMAQGKFSVRRDPKGTLMAVRDLDGLELVRPEAGLRTPAPKVEEIPVHTLLQQVKAAQK